MKSDTTEKPRMELLNNKFGEPHLMPDDEFWAYGKSVETWLTEPLLWAAQDQDRHLEQACGQMSMRIDLYQRALAVFVKSAGDSADDLLQSRVIENYDFRDEDGTGTAESCFIFKQKKRGMTFRVVEKWEPF